jgi:hypothetical protein
MKIQIASEHNVNYIQRRCKDKNNKTKTSISGDGPDELKRTASKKLLVFVIKKFETFGA